MQKPGLGSMGRVAIFTAFLMLSLVGGRAAATNRHVVLITIDGLAAFYLSDPLAPIPVLRKLAAEGAVAEGLRVSNPSVTWPNHTTLVTGVHPEKHSVLFNGMLVRNGPGNPVKVDPFRAKSDLVAVETIYDVLHKAGLKTADINWPCTRGADSLDFSFPDVPEQISHMTPRLRDELVTVGILEDATDPTFRRQSAARRDQIWTAAAIHVVEKHRPNFMLFHMLITDGIQHGNGPQTADAYTALALADAHLADFLDALRRAGILEQTTLLITSDHGFEKVTKRINPNVLLRKAGLLDPDGKTDVQSISEGGSAFAYWTDPTKFETERARVEQLLRRHEGIEAIYGPEKFAELHLPLPSENKQMAHLVLGAKPGYAFSNEATADESITELKNPTGSHGYLATNPRMNGVFVAWGRGIKPHTKLGLINNTDIAPTIAKLLEVTLSQADGNVLQSVLE